MTQIITSSSTTAGVNITAAAAELIFISEGIIRASTSNSGLVASQSGAKITVNGALIGKQSGISLSDAVGTNGFYDVTIGATGLVTGQNTGLFLEDDQNQVTNHGEISANDFVGIYSEGADFQLVNSGTITGYTDFAVLAHGANFQLYNSGAITSHGSTGVFTSSSGFQLTNTGEIVGLIGAGVYTRGIGSEIINYGLIQSLNTRADVPGLTIFDDEATQVVTLTNYGTISAAGGVAVQGDFSQTDEIYNFGNLNGDVVQSGGNDKLVNTGTILGDAHLGDGDDKYDGRGGTVIGTVQGGRGTDVLIGGDGEDVLDGGDGRDVVRGGIEADELNGGGGAEDWLDYRGSTARVVVNLGTGQADGGDAAGDSFSGFERLIGSNLNDTLTGNSANNVLRGNNGNDFVRGASGNDLIAGGRGSDILDGGNGVDALDYRTSDAAVSVNLANDTASGGDADGDTIRNFESIYGSKFNDKLTGDAGANLLSGQAGKDTFVFSSSLGGGNIDTINDFNVAADQIELENAIFSAIAQFNGTLLSGYFKANASGVATDFNDRIIYDTSSGELYYDADGNGAGTAQQFAKLAGGLALTFNDFDVI